MLPSESHIPTQRQSNRRSYQRFALSIPIRFRSEMLDFNGQAMLMNGQLIDISRGGVFVRSDFFEMPGTPVQLQLGGSPQLPPVHLEGHVAWIMEGPPKGPGMGIKLEGELFEQDLFEQLLGLKDGADKLLATDGIRRAASDN